MSDEIDVEEIVCPLCNKDVLYCECSESRLYDAINALRQQLSAAQAQAEAMKKRLDVAKKGLEEIILGKTGCSLSADLLRRSDIAVAEVTLSEIAALEEGEK